MDQHEIDLLEKHAPEDPELKSLWDDHLLYEKQIEKLEAILADRNFFLE